MQIWFLSNGSYSLKKCHNPFGKAIQPPPLTAKFRLNTENPYVVLPLVKCHICRISHTKVAFRSRDLRNYLDIF